MTDMEELPIVIDIEGDELSARQQSLLRVLLADWCDAEDQVDQLFSGGRCIAVGACSGGGVMG